MRLLLENWSQRRPYLRDHLSSTLTSQRGKGELWCFPLKVEQRNMLTEYKFSPLWRYWNLQYGNNELFSFIADCSRIKIVLVSGGTLSTGKIIHIFKDYWRLQEVIWRHLNCLLMFKNTSLWLYGFIWCGVCCDMIVNFLCVNNGLSTCFPHRETDNVFNIGSPAGLIA